MRNVWCALHRAGGSMVLSGISCFFLWFGTSESMMIFMLCLYNGLSISAWNSLDVVTTELYPTDRRSVEPPPTGNECFWIFPTVGQKDCGLVTAVFSVLLSFPGAQALVSAMPCASWQRCWATWSLARWLASPKLFPSCWRHRCWSVAAWWDSDCQTHGPTSSCKPGGKTDDLPGFWNRPIIYLLQFYQQIYVICIVSQFKSRPLNKSVKCLVNNLVLYK